MTTTWSSSRFSLGTFLLAAALPGRAAAENGARLIGLGPSSRSMGGVGVAAPQDAIAAVTSNPAGLSFRPRPEKAEFDFAGTLIVSDGDASVRFAGEEHVGHYSPVFPIATIGMAQPLREDLPAVQGGFSIFAAGGFGVDYRDTDLDQPGFYDLGGGATAPLIVGEFSRFQALSFSPALSVQPIEWASIGVAMPLTASTLDLRQGSSIGYSVGAQVGATVQPHDRLLLGVTYLTAQKTKFRDVIDRDQDGAADSVEIELPQQVGLGAAVEPIAGVLLVEIDVKWLDWSGAEGFKQLDWRDQWVIGLGVQGRPIPSLALRAGYNYGRTPVKRQSGFDGTRTIDVEGVAVPEYYHETGRVIGNPALAEHHLTCGLAYDVSPTITTHVGVLFTPRETLREEGTDILGQPVQIRTTIDYTFTFELGVTFRY